MAQTISNRPSTLASVQNIMNKRMAINKQMVGQYIIFTVRGNGNIIPVLKDGEPVPSITGDGTMLEKQIFNVVCNSGVAIANARNQQILRDAYAAEQAQDFDKAGELYNDYLNKVQVSFSVLSSSRFFNAIKDGDQVKGRVQLIKTDNGELLTIDSGTISIKEAGYGAETKVDLLSMLAPDTSAEGEESTEGADAAATTAADALAGGTPATVEA